VDAGNSAGTDAASFLSRRRANGGDDFQGAEVRMIDPKTRNAFEDIYREDRWTHGSGPGSVASSTIEYRAFVERFIKENDVKSVTDLGCGDWQFSKLMDWSGIDYVGFDVVDFIVERNNSKHATKNISFRTLQDIDDLPGGDLLLTKEVLQHLPNATIIEYIRLIKQRYRFALITNAVEPLAIANGDIAPGDWRPLRLDQAPFHVAGATVLNYFPQSGSHFWRNNIFLMMGDA
jgi:SAM-dependent methyltransferase